MALLDPLSSARRLLASAGLSLMELATARATGFPIRARDISARWLTDPLTQQYPGVEVRSLGPRGESGWTPFGAC